MTPASMPPDLDTYSGRFAARLRKLREKAGLTVAEAAEAIQAAGFTAAARTVYSWEANTSAPKFDTLPAVAKAYGVKRVRDLLPIE